MDGINLGGGLFGWVESLGEVESELVWEGGLDFCKGVGRPGNQEHREAYSRLLLALFNC